MTCNYLGLSFKEKCDGYPPPPPPVNQTATTIFTWFCLVHLHSEFLPNTDPFQVVLKGSILLCYWIQKKFAGIIT
jgi:hypothetical protein